MSPEHKTHKGMKPSFLLRFISGEYAGTEFPVYEGKALYAGRNPELDIVLYDDLVSREHTKIECINGVVQVTDLDSTNGTYLYAERIKQARLEPGDRLIIGASILQLTKRGTSTGLRPVPKRLLEKGTQVMFSGHLADIPLIDMLQMLHINKKTGVVVIASPQQKGAVFLKEGAVVFGQLDGQNIAPLKAVYRMLAWTEGTFEFGASKRNDFDRPIPIPTQTLLMEGIKHNDALDAMRRELPLDHQKICIPRPMQSLLADLDQEQLRFLQIAHNAHAVATYLDTAPASDLDAYRVLVHLIKAGYLEIDTLSR